MRICIFISGLKGLNRFHFSCKPWFLFIDESFKFLSDIQSYEEVRSRSNVHLSCMLFKMGQTFKWLMG